MRCPDGSLVDLLGSLSVAILGPKESPPAVLTGGSTRGATAEACRRKGTILLVDDEPAVCELLSALLSDDGYSSITADCTPTALSLFAEHQAEITAVITDLRMPGPDGIALATALRGMAPNLKIALMTGSLPTELEHGLHGLGETIPILLKPFSKRALLDCVNALSS